MYQQNDLPAYPGMPASWYRSEGESEGRKCRRRVVRLVLVRRAANTHLRHAELVAPTHCITSLYSIINFILFPIIPIF